MTAGASALTVTPFLSDILARAILVKPITAAALEAL